MFISKERIKRIQTQGNVLKRKEEWSYGIWRKLELVISGELSQSPKDKNCKLFLSFLNRVIYCKRTRKQKWNCVGETKGTDGTGRDTEGACSECNTPLRRKDPCNPGGWNKARHWVPALSFPSAFAPLSVFTAGILWSSLLSLCPLCPHELPLQNTALVSEL